jgi:hypothetical protein
MVGGLPVVTIRGRDDLALDDVVSHRFPVGLDEGPAGILDCHCLSPIAIRM